MAKRKVCRKPLVFKSIDDAGMKGEWCSARSESGGGGLVQREEALKRRDRFPDDWLGVEGVSSVCQARGWEMHTTLQLSLW